MVRTLIAVVLGLAAAGCELTVELGSYENANAGTDSTSSSGTSSAGTSGESGSGSESETGTESGDGGGVCGIDGSEPPCEVCLEHLCCAELEACGEDIACFCMLDCLLISDPVDCAMTCTPGEPYFQLVQCRATSCASVCE